MHWRRLPSSQKNLFLAIARHLDKIVNSELPLSSYVLSKSRARQHANEAAMPHMNVVNLKEQRMPGSGDPVGSRVMFFYREKTKMEAKLPKSKDKVSQRAEDPVYGAEHGIKPDRAKYIGDIRGAVMSVFAPLKDDRVPLGFDDAERKSTTRFQANKISRAFFLLLQGRRFIERGCPSCR